MFGGFTVPGRTHLRDGGRYTRLYLGILVNYGLIGDTSLLSSSTVVGGGGVVMKELV